MKKKRQQMIISLIRDNDILTQDELAEKLGESGFAVTQATISRDIRELNLTKVMTESGQMKYVVAEDPVDALQDKYIRVLKECTVSVDMAQNILVIKTVSGMAMAVAAAMDALNFQEIVGSIAGDDTIFCALRSVEDTRRIMKKVRGLL
ncbi:MAG: arginine repressor [Lachnospiraceae bacterium]|nr:arginine repressor [Lachnospiraceae bacterium]